MMSLESLVNALLTAGIEDWKQNALGVINRILNENLKLKVVNVIGGGDQEWAVVELEADGVCKNGEHFAVPFGSLLALTNCTLC